MKEKLVLLSVGTIVSVFVAILGFLSSSFFGGFVTKAEYEEDKQAIIRIETNQSHLIKGQREIKELLRSRNGGSGTSGNRGR